jgi:hypothetical protein
MQHGKPVVACKDAAQITKISKTTKENTLAFQRRTHRLPFRVSHNHDVFS